MSKVSRIQLPQVLTRLEFPSTMTDQTDNPLADYPVVITLPVQWSDQDAVGHVNNTVPIRWFESARIEYVERTGISTPAENDRIGPILASVRCDFRRQINFPDTVRIGARVTRLGRSSIAVAHAVYSESQSAIVAEGDSVMVVFDYEANRSHPIPDELRAAIERIEGRKFSD